ncbi:hypothetical protein BUALT_Bualt06G0064200 [Buddleja alternifolia]|uniref:Uncharacterized protein n=1 Tax=Buddleja alternifolia TaxID=168488 RepID=A0AAV6XD77_9LAMI|nr:hypothetical protein BUALT_Bualt06G0064200 [Buddleja alternifolia]
MLGSPKPLAPMSMVDFLAARREEGLREGPKDDWRASLKLRWEGLDGGLSGGSRGKARKGRKTWYLDGWVGSAVVEGAVVPPDYKKRTGVPQSVRMEAGGQKLMLIEPNLEEAHPDVGETAEMYKNDRAMYESTAREWTQLYAQYGGKILFHS